MVGDMAGSRRRKAGRGGSREPLIELGEDPFAERLDTPPAAAPSTAESTHDKARRVLIAEPGQWVVLNARVKLNEASARRMARSYQRAKPARLVPTATGRFTARPFVREDTWLVAAVYEPAPAGQ